MGFMEMVQQAKNQAKRDGDFLAPNQRGTILIKNFATFKGLSGKYTVLEGTLVECSPKAAGGPHQPVGTHVKIWTGLYGSVKKVEASFANIRNYLQEVTGCGDDGLAEALKVVFGDGEDGVAAEASAKAKAHPGFGARGVLVDSDTYERADKNDPSKKYTRVKLQNRTKGNEDEEILKRQQEMDAK